MARLRYNNALGKLGAALSGSAGNPAFNGSSDAHAFAASTITIPATAHVGDLLLLFVSTNPTAPVITSLTGWTLVATNSSGVKAAGTLFKRTCVAGDPGSTVAIPDMGGWDWIAEIRSYTCNGIDNVVTGKVDAVSTYAPLAPTQSGSNEAQVSFFGVGYAAGGTAPPSLAAGGSNTLITNSGRGFIDGASEDWAGSPSGGAVSDASGPATFVQIAVSLLPPPPTTSTITFDAVPPFATLAGGDYIPLVLEPPGGSPSPHFEIVYLTAYTAGATTGTISRAQAGTSASAHASGAAWAHGPVAKDFALRFRGQWNNNRAYDPDDAVIYNGAAYRCISSVTLGVASLSGETTNNAGPNNTPTALAIPAGASAGDLALLFVGCTNNGAIATPTGWTLVTNRDQSGGLFVARGFVFKRVLVAGDLGGSVTVTVTGDNWVASLRTYHAAGGVDATAGNALFTPPAVGGSAADRVVACCFLTAQTPPGASFSTPGQNDTLVNSTHQESLALQDGVAPLAGVVAVSGVNPSKETIAVAIAPGLQPTPDTDTAHWSADGV